jgi:hypothetical protein
VNGHFELTVESAGVLSLPEEVLGGLGAVPGDVLSLDVGPLSVYLGLEIYREFLADNWEAVSADNRWRFLHQFLSRPLTAVEREGSRFRRRFFLWWRERDSFSTS